MDTDCPDCGTEMDEASDMNCSKANYVCPTCAPSWVHEMATSDEGE